MRMLLVLAVGILSACQSASDAEPSQVEVAESAQDDLSVASPPAEGPLEIADPARAASGPAARDTPAPAPRVLIRTADLRLRVRDYDDARRAVAATARRMGAFVAGEAEQRLPYEVTNTLTLRVEAARFDTLMEALAALGEEVVERRVSVDDVTEQAVDLESRLRARRAVEARYVEILGRSGTIEDVLAVEARLAETREAIELAEGQLRGLRDRVALSTITLTISEESPTGITDGPGFFSRLGAAFGTGWDGLLGLVVGLVALWPLALIVPLVVWLWRRVRRLRRPTA